MKNAVYVLHLRKTQDGVWVFDDDRFGLKAEPFVGDTNTVIDHVLAKVGVHGSTCSIMFSRYELPKADAHFKLREVCTGPSAWYWCEELQTPFWLCPAMNHYFDATPDDIYVKVLSR